ncbi:hypothetical protein JVT61DRAFT_8742 [Boletus reticuloceps]|uniref:Uncharacterized protein n=1 Tax=Boletus reticuloceps TaxID=495285 RepID=A0A8I2YGY4_9AGAM|nr:hypothetical protein JVT61DRAFT_8742 [Boletus reticuloceps]
MYFVLARGQTPFFDDHIHASDVIVDSLVEFSGIRYMYYVRSLPPPFTDNNRWHIVGGLDPYLSRHALTLLKPVYKNLRLLVD